MSIGRKEDGVTIHGVFLKFVVVCFVKFFPLVLVLLLSIKIFGRSHWLVFSRQKFCISRHSEVSSSIHIYHHPGLTHSLTSVAQSCPNLCDPVNRSTPGLPVHHQLPEFTQTHVHQVSDANQPSHPLLSPSPPTPNPSQHHSLFQ